MAQIFSIGEQRGEADDAELRLEDEAQREALLMRRLLEFPARRGAELDEPDPQLVAFASALLDYDISFDEMLGSACCGSSIQRVLLSVYVAQGRRGGFPIASLCSSPVLGPPTVAMRWALVLLGDGILETAQKGVERTLNVSLGAIQKFEEWLGRTKSNLSGSRTDFAV